MSGSGGNQDGMNHNEAGVGRPDTGSADRPTPPIQPRIVRTHAERGSWWWLLLLLVAVIVAAVAIWYFMFRTSGEVTTAPSPSPSVFSWAGAWARTDASGGGLVIEGAGEEYLVTPYDQGLRAGQTVTATAGADGRALNFTLPALFLLSGPAGPLEATMAPDASTNRATLHAVGTDGTTLSIPLERVAALTPSDLVSPSSAPTVSGSSPSPFPASDESAGELPEMQMLNAIESIQDAIEAWAADNGGMYPMPADVRSNGAIASYVNPWPSNPWAADEPMSPGTEPGDFTYEQLEGALGYRLTGYLDNGTFTVP